MLAFYVLTKQIFQVLFLDRIKQQFSINFHFVPQIDILEDPVIKNVIVLQTVLQEVRNRSAPVYKRIRDVIQNPEKHFYSFTNEHHR